MTFSGTCIKINSKRKIKFERIPKRETFGLIIAISCDNVIWINIVTSLMSYISTLLTLTCSSQQPRMNYIYTFKCLLMLIFHVNKFTKNTMNFRPQIWKLKSFSIYLSPQRQVFRNGSLLEEYNRITTLLS